MSEVTCYLVKGERGFHHFAYFALPAVPRVGEVIWLQRTDPLGSRYVVTSVEYETSSSPEIYVYLRVKEVSYWNGDDV